MLDTKTAETKYHIIRLKRRQWQREAFDPNNMTRFTVLLAARGSGKTTGVADYLIRRALTIPDAHFVYCVPSFKLGLRSFWQQMLKLTRGMEGVNPNRQDMAFYFNLSGSVVWLVSFDDPESQRGIHPFDLVVDEAQNIDTEDFLTVLYPTVHNAHLADPRAGNIIISGTAKYTDNLLHDAYQWGRNPHEPLWSNQVWDVYRTGLYTPEYIENVLKTRMSEDDFEQEYKCSFIRSNELIVYKPYDEAIHLKSRDEIPVPPDADIHAGVDFNVSPLCCAVSVQHEDGLYVFDEISLENSNTEELATELLNRFRGRRIFIYPDQSGRNRKTSAVGETDLTILRRFGFSVYERPGGNPPVLESIRYVNMMLKDAKGDIRLWVAPECKTLRKGLKTLRFKPGTSVPDKGNRHQHMTDALRYLVTFFAPYTGRRRAATQEFIL